MDGPEHGDSPFVQAPDSQSQVDIGRHIPRATRDISLQSESIHAKRQKSAACSRSAMTSGFFSTEHLSDSECTDEEYGEREEDHDV